MRKLNGIVSMCIIVLFLIHAAMGALQLTGLIPGGSLFMKAAAWTMVAFTVVHMVIGIKLTADTLKALKKSGAGYFRENRLFWIRRISGMAIIAFIAVHVMVFLGSQEGGAFRLTEFNAIRLAGQILLVVSVALHVISNIKPLMLGLGAKDHKALGADMLFVISVMLLLSGIAFVIYYIRWRVF
ncbi:MAG: pilus assembly protein PilX [Ruminococcus sp.]|nr:pilus assembly protein PilX [Ruminococcus sp.]